MENPPEFTIENVSATFGDYWINQRHHILKGLAECFCDLDPAYRSHTKVKIGVEGLPKRIIIQSTTGYGSWGWERTRDTLNALNVFRGNAFVRLHRADSRMGLSGVVIQSAEARLILEQVDQKMGSKGVRHSSTFRSYV